MKVAIYCRLSDEDKNKQSENDDSESIQNQKTMLIEYAVKSGWEIYNIYSDDDYRGSDRNRPAFNQLLKEAEKRKFNIVLCKSQARFTRELELVEKYIHDLFIIWGIRFIGLADNADTENVGNKKQRQIQGLVNEWFLEDLSNNIRSVFDTKKAQGLHIGSFTLYGYKKNPAKKGHLLIDEEPANIVREVFELYAEGYGKTNIARILNDKGIPNPSEYKRQQGFRFKLTPNQNGTLWRYSTVASMLTNEMYIGTMVQNKQRNASYKSPEKIMIPQSEWIRVPNTHEPIINTELWDKVQNLVGLRARPFGDTKKIGLFARKLKCKYCGYNLLSKKCHQERYFECATKFVSKKTCTGVCVSLKTIENTVLSELHRLIKEYDIAGDVEKNIIFENRFDGKIEQLEKDLILFQKKIDTATKAVKNLYADKVNGIIQEDEFIEFSREFHDEKNRCREMITTYEAEIECLKNKANMVVDKKQLFEEFSNIEKLERIHVEKIIDYVEVGKRYPGTKKREITIYWNF